MKKIKLNRKFKATVKRLKEASKMEVSHLLRLAFAFTHLQIKTRPRLRLVSRLIVILFIMFLASSKAMAYVKPKEANIKINGQAVLVAQEKPVEAPEGGISQGVHALRSPFLYEKPIADGPVSQGYSFYHPGLDITSPIGTPVKPVGPGIVEFAGFRADGYGNTVIVDHGDGLKTLYAHMNKISVGAGNNVTPDISIGTVGITGRTTGPHVHFEVREKDVQVNPLNLLP